jgi:DNA-binding NarL/FixJ family response regulator
MIVATNETPCVRRVLIVDDHSIVRLGLRRIIENEKDLMVCGEAETAREASAAIKELRPDVMIVDLSLKHGDSIDLVRGARGRHPRLAILVLSMHEETTYAERMLAAGANGYIMKQEGSEQFLISLRRVLDGGIYVSETVGLNMIQQLTTRGSSLSSDPIDRLSNRELQILRMIGQGTSAREAALSLNLSVKTVESHRQRIKRKLNLKTGAKLVQYAVSWLIRGESGGKGLVFKKVTDATEALGCFGPGARTRSILTNAERAPPGVGGSVAAPRAAGSATSLIEPAATSGYSP